MLNDKLYLQNIFVKIENNELYIQKKGIIKYGFERRINDKVIIINRTVMEDIISGKESSNVRDTGVLQIKKQRNNENMIYSTKLGLEISRIKKALYDENFNKIRKKMKKDGLSESMIFLFYGPTGTGKSMSVYSIARETGREIVEVDMGVVNGGGLVGDTERETKKIFTDYRLMCKSAEKMPILLINEADSLLTRRVSVRGHNDLTNNFKINIILDELDKFDGILFATTNLEQDFDKAMDRRFLQKIKFPMPDDKMRAIIWEQKLPVLTKADCKLLSKYLITGGIIENIARRCRIQSNLELRDPNINEVLDMARMEVKFRTEEHRSVGFLQTDELI